MAIIVYQHVRTRRGDEHGFVLVYTAFFVVFLMIVAAFVVDIGNARQQKTGAQAAADSAALTGTQLLNSTTSDAWYWAAATAAFHSLNVGFTVTDDTTPYSTDCGSGCRDYTYASGATNYAVKVTTPWNGDATRLGVQVCSSVPTSFARVVGINALPYCVNSAAGGAVAGSTSNSGGCGASSQLFSTTTVPTNGSGGVDAGTTIQTTYDTYDSPPTGNGTGLPLDTSRLYFVAQNQYGNFTRLSPTLSDQSPPGYTMTKVVISYTIPAAMDSFSASLGATDIYGKNCGQTGWTTCTNEENFFESSDTDKDTAHDVVSDGDEDVTPKGGQLTNVAATNVSANYNDETNINPLTTNLLVDGQPVSPNYGAAGASTAGYSMSSWPPSGWQYVSADTSQEVDKSPNASTDYISVLLSDNLQAMGAPTPPAPYPAFTLKTPGLPVAGYPITVTPYIWSPTAPNYTGVPAAGAVAQTATTALDGSAYFTFTDSVKESVYFVVSYGNSTTNSRGTGAVTQLAGVGFNGAANPSGLPSATNATAWPTPGGKQETFSWSPANLSNGWHSMFLYTKDGDQNKAGGDCGFVNWSFPATGGASGSLNLIG